MRLQVHSILDAAVLLGTGVSTALALGVRSVRRTPRAGAVVAQGAEG